MGLLLLFQPPQKAFEPDELSTLRAWYLGDTLAGSDGSAVSTWPDSSGNGHDATATGVGGPNPNTLQTSELDGKNVVDIQPADSGTGSWFDLPSGVTSGLTEGSAFYVANVRDDAFSGALMGKFGTAVDADHEPLSDGTIYHGFLSNARKTVGDPGVMEQWHIGSLRSKASDWRYAYNAADFFTTATNTVGAGGSPRIGANGASNLWNGMLAEVVICSSFLTELERHRVEGYLAWKWGLVASLPADHPYKNNAPTVDDTAKVLTAAVGVYTITGTAVGLKAARTLAAAPGAYAITGTAVTLSRTRSLAAAVGAYAITGTATALRAARTLAAAVGAYAITGTVTALRRGFSLALTPGAYAITGQTTGLKAARRLTATPGAYSISGAATALRIARRLAAAVGAYVISGQTVALKAARRLAAAVGAYNYTGTATALRISRRLVIAPGAYAYTGQAAALRRAAAVVLTTGSYSINGQPVALIFGRRVQFAVGAYVYTGQSATLQLVTTPFFPNNDPAGVALSNPLAPALVSVTVAVAPMAVPAVAPAAVLPPQAFVKAAAPGAVNLE